MSDTFNPLTLASMRQHMLDIGYRAETVSDAVAGMEYLRSATGGLTFDIRMGNKLSSAEEEYADATFVTVFNVVGEFPLEPVNIWNCSHRFGRLQIDASNPGYKFLVLCMDVVVAGGISRQNLRAQVAIWDGLIQQFVPWLREQVSNLRADVAANGNGAEMPMPTNGKAAEANIVAAHA